MLKYVQVNGLRVATWSRSCQVYTKEQQITPLLTPALMTNNTNYIMSNKSKVKSKQTIKNHLEVKKK